jgi:hypothetical protein
LNCGLTELVQAAERLAGLQVPEDQRMNAEKKMCQMILLEESIHVIRMRFNNRLDLKVLSYQCGGATSSPSSCFLFSRLKAMRELKLDIISSTKKVRDQVRLDLYLASQASVCFQDNARIREIDAELNQV